VRNSGASTFQHGDRLGTFSLQTNASQTATATRRYDAFGNLLSSTGTAVGAFGFAGKSGYQEDSDSSLKLLGHRYYNPSTGRFLTRDRAKEGRNWYTYVSSMATVKTDATGLDPEGGSSPQATSPPSASATKSTDPPAYDPKAPWKLGPITVSPNPPGVGGSGTFPVDGSGTGSWSSTWGGPKSAVQTKFAIAISDFTLDLGGDLLNGGVKWNGGFKWKCGSFYLAIAVDDLGQVSGQGGITFPFH
jgi:RHS repeat-associated protein